MRIKTVSTSRRAPPQVITAYTEVIGTVEEVGEDYVIMSFSNKCIVHTKQGEPIKWRLKMGDEVAILLLNDRSIRVRNLDGKVIGNYKM